MAKGNLVKRWSPIGLGGGEKRGKKGMGEGNGGKKGTYVIFSTIIILKKMKLLQDLIHKGTEAQRC